MADNTESVWGLDQSSPSATMVEFKLPVHLTADKFITQLSHLVDMQLLGRQHIVKTYYDSFDWRLYSNGLLCEVNAAKNASSFLLRELAGNVIVHCTGLKTVPAFGGQFDQKIRNVLEPILEMRALSPVCTLDCECLQANVINKDEKAVLRLLIESYGVLDCTRVSLQPIKGYGKVAEHIITLMTAKLALTPISGPVLLEALKQQGKRPNDYSAKLNINLAPDMRADIASKYIYSHLLKIIKANEPGVIADIDSEFLHDYRVAIRKTRSGLSQLKGILPEAANAQFAGFFSWLGQITTPTRDLDVYLLNFEDYKNSLPAQIREDLNPLHDFLWEKKRNAQRELAKKLHSEKYATMLSGWEQYLKGQAAHYPVEAHAKLTISQLADLRIWKVYKRVLQEGDSITRQSEAEALHELRKTCKKLRYLMEFFDSLYPRNDMKKLLDHLKALQEVLGAFQDYQVQENHLQQFSEEMSAGNNVPVKTFLAMGMLIQYIDESKQKARSHFDLAFSAFRTPDNHKLFKKLFAKKTA